MDLATLTEMYDFTGRTVVVTGGTGALCGELARALAGCRANVCLLARDEERGARALAELKGAGRARVVRADALAADSLRAALGVVVEEFGRVDALVNGAGGNHPQATAREGQPFFDLPEEALRHVFDLNLLGTILPCQVFGRRMASQGEGVILNVSSMAALRPLTRVVGYSAAKAGVENFTRWLAVHMAEEYSPRIRVNAVAPGFFVTEQNRDLLVERATGEPTARGRSVIAHTPMRRFGAPEDLIGAALWLLSPASGFVTGAVIPVDGGFSAFGGV
jgi:NAD(P)-dependent dehydrogenase (short-subunit alcohol dehydrogenase family)